MGGSLVRGVEENGGISRENKSRLLELRFAHELHNAGIAPAYEIQGEGQSNLDFGFNSAGRDWRVELMRLEETAAARAATTAHADEDGIVWSQRILTTNAEDPTRSEEGETIKAVQRICQKCEKDGLPYKFPRPNGALHALLIDFRTFLHGGDEYDRIHVGLGGAWLPDAFLRRYWAGRLIAGVFDLNNPMRGAPHARERVHFLGFVRERFYQPGEFASVTQFIANPHLFANAQQVREALATWPLQPTRTLNAG
ncbi:MAG: hypothetical protein NVV83_22155 [Afipia sp.]|nr:hypothetical protein [Afipia sp.]